MSNVAKLKKKAAEFELKRQFDKALAIYVELLDNFDKNPEEIDVALFNRVGDMLLRQGNVADAVDYYERAVDRYAEGGFFNNAIALCNKILRQSPGRSSIYYKLGKISAQKGFKNDAKQNFLEYADRMQKSGRMDEAFRALKEFADLCPDQDDIRLMLAEQLSRQDRGGEAIEQLQTLVERYSAEGRDVEAGATLDRIKAIDPEYRPRATGPQKTQKSSDIVFLDVYSIGDSAKPAPEVPPPAPSAPAAKPAPAPEPAPLPPEAGDTFADPGEVDASPLSGLETTSFAAPEHVADSGMLDLEPTSFGSGTFDDRTSADTGAGLLDGLESTSFDAPSFDEPASSPADEGIATGDTFDFLVPPDTAPDDAPSMTPDLEFFMPDMAEDLTATPALPEPGTAAPTAADAGTIEFGVFEFQSEPDEAVQPGTAASVPEVGIDDALQGLPMMDFALPTGPVIDDARTSQSFEISDFSFESAPEPSGGAGLEDPPLSTAGEEAVAELESFPSALEDEREVPLVPQGDDRTRRSTIAAEQSVELLAAMADTDPADFGLRRRLAEARLDSGDRAGGLADLDAAMVGYERTEDLGAAASIADEIARITPDSVRIHQKRVEYAFRTNERARLVGAYLDLAAALLGDGQTDKAKTVYRRVLDLAPDDIAAQAGLAALSTAEVEAAVVPPPTPEPAPAPAVRQPFRPRTAAAQAAATQVPEQPRAADPKPAPAAPPAPAATPRPADDASFINLGDWLRDDAGPKSTRMVVEEKEPTGDEEADFAEMLRRFKQGVAENVDAEDHQSHYDLGVAFKEMGLIDEAISEFQRALRAPSNRLPTYEALGQCFVEKEQYQVAKAILARALSEPDVSDEQLIGVLYLLGHSSEALGHHQEAIAFYQRVFVVDIQFRDVADRLSAVEQAAR